MSYKLVIAEKPSVAQSIAKVIGADKREDGYLYAMVILSAGAQGTQWDPIPLPWKSDEEALKDFWDYCEERQREERIIAEMKIKG